MPDKSWRYIQKLGLQATIALSLLCVQNKRQDHRAAPTMAGCTPRYHQHGQFNTQGLDIVFARARKGWHARVRVPPCQTEAAYVAAKGIKWAMGSVEVALLWGINLKAGALVGLSLVVLHGLGVARLVCLQAAQLTQETQAKRLACNHVSTSSCQTGAWHSFLSQCSAQKKHSRLINITHLSLLGVLDLVFVRQLLPQSAQP